MRITTAANDATVLRQTAVNVTALRQPAQRIYRTSVYSGIAGICILIAVLGFGPGSMQRVINGNLNSPWIVHLHAAIYSFWLVLFLLQAILIYQQRVENSDG